MNSVGLRDELTVSVPTMFDEDCGQFRDFLHRKFSVCVYLFLQYLPSLDPLDNCLLDQSNNRKFFLLLCFVASVIY